MFENVNVTHDLLNQVETQNLRQVMMLLNPDTFSLEDGSQANLLSLEPQHVRFKPGTTKNHSLIMH